MENQSKQILKIEQLLSEAEIIPRKHSTTVVYIESEPFILWIINVMQFFIDNFNRENAYTAMFDTFVIGNEDIDNPKEKDLFFACNILENLKKYLIENPEFPGISIINPLKEIELLCN